MANRPAAELEVTPALAVRLLAEQHPDLAGLPVRAVASGWDNALLRLGDDLALRLPRREAAAHLVGHEQRWLPVLAPRLGVPVPVPVRVGVPSPLFPWAWSVVPWLVGEPAIAVAAAERRSIATALADVVVRLHVPAPGGAPANPFRGVPLAARDAGVRVRLAEGRVADADRLARLWDELVATPPWPGAPTWAHGDLHPANLLIGADGALAAVLDFGDLTAGDPAVDLATGWLTFDAVGRRAFIDRVTATAGTSPDTWRRARGWALVLALAFGANADDDPAFAALGARALREVLAG
ncbi:aminoglycoside phosphotransferase family protein [Pengzhenrongella sicca]|uniref:Aminoglycoside phosphotransferase family protein n=1 Tax=Pengzhenrongella sicca TaxID=2819238 RepID=A0A8A4ZIE0_9MICO|nr:aminoglycoside phosphotransferase family protein [Pengzhenrongella sicca]QTE30763.1 aminoglycoside phosphotransferase family protein [Pengzhenrongella sicca]